MVSGTAGSLRHLWTQAGPPEVGLLRGQTKRVTVCAVSPGPLVPAERSASGEADPGLSAKARRADPVPIRVMREGERLLHALLSQTSVLAWRLSHIPLRAEGWYVPSHDERLGEGRRRGIS